MSDWEPIETAPKDGQPLDLWMVTVRGKKKIVTQERVIDAFWEIMPYNGGRWARHFYSLGDDYILDAATSRRQRSTEGDMTEPQLVPIDITHIKVTSDATEARREGLMVGFNLMPDQFGIQRVGEISVTKPL